MEVKSATRDFSRVTHLRRSSFIHKKHDNLMVENNNVTLMSGRTKTEVSSGAQCSGVRCKRRDARDFVLVW